MISKFNIVNLAIALPVDGIFSYCIPKSMSSSISIGKRVLVDFNNRQVIGYILEIKYCREVSKFKNIIKVVDKIPLFPKRMGIFFKWISDYYMYPIGEVIKIALPKGLNYTFNTQVSILKEGKFAYNLQSISVLEKKILKSIIEEPLSIKELKLSINAKINSLFLEKMERKKWLKIKKFTNIGKMQNKTITYVSSNVTHKNDKISIQRKKILNYLNANRKVPLKNLISKLSTTTNLIKKMEKDKQVKTHIADQEKFVFLEKEKVKNSLELTKEQYNAVNKAGNFIGKKFKTFLLNGVTGSGKTEVYLRLTKIALNRGLPVLILVPEIALVSKLTHDLQSFFNKHVAILHSGLSKSLLHSQWLNILEHKTMIAVGARSCIFAPFDNLGLIIVDEEHDTSYKQERVPFYNGKDLAIVRAKYCNAVVVLGSATPSIQSWFNVKNGKFIELPMPYRVKQKSLPHIKIIDLSKNNNFKGIERYFTADLIKAMNATLKDRKQIILFLNRRGFATLSLCMKCKKPIRCKNCDTSLTLHKNINLFICHYCGFSKPYNSKCKYCGFNHIQSFGVGTEKIEVMVKKMFPQAKVSRFDKDTTKKKGSAAKILKSLKNHEIDVLIGTQMLAKGHDFTGVTLVGILCADLTMNFPDFRSTERTFQLISQVAGRAGRGKGMGKVILQTYSPDHFSIRAAKKQDFKEFYKTEIKFRKMLDYPPFSRMIQVRISGKDKLKVIKHSQNTYKWCSEMLSMNKLYYKKIIILGPIESPISRIDKFYRWQIMIKSRDTNKLHSFTRELISSKKFKSIAYIRVSIDVDPVFMM